MRALLSEIENDRIYPVSFNPRAEYFGYGPPAGIWAIAFRSIGIDIRGAAPDDFRIPKPRAIDFPGILNKDNIT